MIIYPKITNRVWLVVSFVVATIKPSESSVPFIQTTSGSVEGAEGTAHASINKESVSAISMTVCKGHLLTGGFFPTTPIKPTDDNQTTNTSTTPTSDPNHTQNHVKIRFCSPVEFLECVKTDCKRASERCDKVNRAFRKNNPAYSLSQLINADADNTPLEVIDAGLSVLQIIETLDAKYTPDPTNPLYAEFLRRKYNQCPFPQEMKAQFEIKNTDELKTEMLELQETLYVASKKVTGIRLPNSNPEDMQNIATLCRSISRIDPIQDKQNTIAYTRVMILLANELENYFKIDAAYKKAEHSYLQTKFTQLTKVRYLSGIRGLHSVIEDYYKYYMYSNIDRNQEDQATFDTAFRQYQTLHSAVLTPWDQWYLDTYNEVKHQLGEYDARRSDVITANQEMLKAISVFKNFEDLMQVVFILNSLCNLD